MSTWLFIGTVLGAVLLIAYLVGHSRRVWGVEPQYLDPKEQKRRLDQHTKEVSSIRSYQRGPDGGASLS